MDEIKSVLSFQDYLVDTIEFHLNENYEDISDTITPELYLNSDFSVVDENSAVVSLECIIFNEPEKKNKPFRLKVKMTGFFKFKGDISSEPRRNMLEANATAILYPYLRSLVSNITSSAGLPTLILPLINVYKFIQAKSK